MSIDHIHDIFGVGCKLNRYEDRALRHCAVNLDNVCLLFVVHDCLRTAANIRLEPAESCICNFEPTWQDISAVCRDRPCRRLRLNPAIPAERRGYCQQSKPGVVNREYGSLCWMKSTVGRLLNWKQRVIRHVIRHRQRRDVNQSPITVADVDFYTCRPPSMMTASRIFPVTSLWLERTSCRFPVTLLVLCWADCSTSQVLTTSCGFYHNFGLLQ